MGDRVVTTHELHFGLDGEDYSADWATWRVMSVAVEPGGWDGGPQVRFMVSRVWVPSSGRVGAPQVGHPPADVAERAVSRLRDALRAGGVEVDGL
jgi:hypothetical protein